MSPDADLGDDEVAAVVRAGYDDIAEPYLRHVASQHAHPRHAWLARLLTLLPPDSQVLELGCGPGVPAARDLVAAGHRVVGVDISPRQVALARQSVPDGTFLEADMLDLEFAPDSFDAVVALYSIIHVPRRHYPVLFGRIRQWITPQGWFLASLGTGDSPGWLEDDLLGFGGANWTNSYDPNTTKRLLRESGLIPEVAEIVAQDEPSGPERWLYVLARPEDADETASPSDY